MNCSHWLRLTARCDRKQRWERKRLVPTGGESGPIELELTLAIIHRILKSDILLVLGHLKSHRELFFGDKTVIVKRDGRDLALRNS